MNIVGIGMLKISLFCVLAQFLLCFYAESVKTIFGTDIVYKDGYEWVPRVHNKALTKTTWRCTKSNICRARAESDYGSTELTVIVKHTHVPNFNSQIVRERKEQGKLLAKQNINSRILPPKDIWTEVIKELTLEQRASLPDYPAFSQMVFNQRALPETTALNKPAIKDIKVEGQHLHDANNKNFFLYDSRTDHPDKPEIFIFGSEEGVLRLTEYKDWSMDGTFYVAPRPWQQLYLINVLIDKSSVPCIYALVNGKDTDTYKLLFEQVAEALPEEFSPSSIIVDNERAVVNALHDVWPKAPVRFCLFHLAQAVYKRVVNEKLTKDYASEENSRFTIRRLTALSALPVDMVSRAFDLIEKDLVNKKFQPVLNYFKRNYVRRDTVKKTPTKPRFPPETWNHRQTILDNFSRANNAIESFNRQLNAHYKSKHPSLSNLLNVLKAEDKLAAEKLTQYKMNPSQGLSLKPKSRPKPTKSGNPNAPPKGYNSHDQEILAAVTKFDALPDEKRTDKVIMEHLDTIQLHLMNKKIDDIMYLPDDDEIVEDEEGLEILRDVE